MGKAKVAKKLLISSVVGCGVVASGASAFDYDVYGGAYMFSKIGFNNVKVNENTGKYPTDSWASIALDLNIKGSFVDGFTYGLGGMLSAPVWDPYQASYAYINGNARHSLNNNSNDEIGYRYYVLATAYLGYQFKNDTIDVGIKAGRFDDLNTDWFSGFGEGVKLWAGNDLIKFQFNWITRRAFAYNEWFYDFYSVGKADKWDYNRDFLVGAFDINVGDFNIKPQVWYHRNDYIAPGLNLGYTFDNGIVSAKTSAYSLFILSHKNLANGVGMYRNGTDNKLSTILIVKEDISHMGWDFGLGVRKNWGNPRGNSGMGQHGNPSGLDDWTASAGTKDFWGFDAWALNDINGWNAFTGWLSMGKAYESFDWNIIARVTTAKESDEQSIALNMGYNATEVIRLGLKLEWFNDISKRFERVNGVNLPSGNPYSAELQSIDKVRNDRSHAFLTFEYKF
ncbi:hypothetical protein CCY99_06800 [Helicobacter sp. 16-1353]|uniref:outer membrane family protein n=1 Tax=Helicobacter sp. 16-1353 TaxID=2004996 RepID=UPI000DCE5E75|nr:outer membrane family protein [Helicobacter sp. 16-1353]RAX53069.1 hypothetical protein CCY99_06800 [Helicobacter sp. 16-1353]